VIELKDIKISVGSRIATVLEILYDADRSIFLVHARMYLPGSDYSVSGMVGTFRAAWGEGPDLGAAMKACAVKLKNKEQEFYRK
jgi:hypothetical protein